MPGYNVAKLRDTRRISGSGDWGMKTDGLRRPRSREPSIPTAAYEQESGL